MVHPQNKKSQYKSTIKTSLCILRQQNQGRLRKCFVEPDKTDGMPPVLFTTTFVHSRSSANVDYSHWRKISLCQPLYCSRYVPMMGPSKVRCGEHFWDLLVIYFAVWSSKRRTYIPRLAVMRDKHISLCWGSSHWWILEITLNMAKTDQGDRVQGLHRFRRLRRDSPEGT